MSRRQGGCCKGFSGALVVAGSPSLDAAEVIFDGVMEALGAVGILGGIAAFGDDREGTLILDFLAHFLAVVGFVGGDSEGRAKAGEKSGDRHQMVVVHFQ
jgi:hypothetical protein